MKKFDNTGGIASVRTIPMMNQGGSAEQRLADGPPPKQFSLPEEEKVIPSEPNVLIKPNRETGTIFTIHDPTFNYPMSSEPEMSDMEAGALQISRLKNWFTKLFKKGEPDEHQEHWGIGS